MKSLEGMERQVEAVEELAMAREVQGAHQLEVGVLQVEKESQMARLQTKQHLGQQAMLPQPKSMLQPQTKPKPACSPCSLAPTTPRWTLKVYLAKSRLLLLRIRNLSQRRAGPLNLTTATRKLSYKSSTLQ